MAGEDLEARRRLTFGQAHGLEPLPKQLSKTEMPPRLRAKLWELFELIIDEATYYSSTLMVTTVHDDLFEVLKRHHIDIKEQFSDTFPKQVTPLKKSIRILFTSGSYIDVLNFVEHFLKSGYAVRAVSPRVNTILEEELFAYRVFDNDVIGLISDDSDQQTIELAFSAINENNAQGARSHLRRSIEFLNNSRYADSVRESINAVESIAKVLSADPKTELGGALKALEHSSNIHGGMRAAFNSLYGYTSDEKGIRHSLLFRDEANVDETDALFMIGACSAFVTYLINRTRNAGISMSSSVG